MYTGHLIALAIESNGILIGQTHHGKARIKDDINIKYCSKI